MRAALRVHCHVEQCRRKTYRRHNIPQEVLCQITSCCTDKPHMRTEKKKSRRMLTRTSQDFMIPLTSSGLHQKTYIFASGSPKRKKKKEKKCSQYFQLHSFLLNRKSRSWYEVGSKRQVRDQQTKSVGFPFQIFLRFFHFIAKLHK